MAVSLVLSRLDFCNSLLQGCGKELMRKLQLAQNAAARVVARVRMRDHISPTLRDLHWLPIAERVEHKMLSITHQAFHDQGPEYLSGLLTKYIPERELRSSSQKLLKIPPKKDICTKSYAERTFSFQAPTLWKPLPLKIKESATTPSFKSRLKTHLFKKGPTF